MVSNGKPRSPRRRDGRQSEGLEKKQRAKSVPAFMGRLGAYPWNDKVFYAEAWLLIIIGTVFGILSLNH